MGCRHLPTMRHVSTTNAPLPEFNGAEGEKSGGAAISQNEDRVRAWCRATFLSEMWKGTSKTTRARQGHLHSLARPAKRGSGLEKHTSRGTQQKKIRSHPRGHTSKYRGGSRVPLPASNSPRAHFGAAVKRQRVRTLQMSRPRKA